MIVPIEINTSDILSQFNIAEKDLDNMLDNIAKSLAVAYVSKLETQANNELHSTRQRYLQNIKLIDSGRLQGIVLLDYSKDPMVKMIEEGASPFDLKPAILNGPKSKVSKKGVRYNTIPFRWATPNAIGESGVFSGKMPSAVYEEIKKKPTVVAMSGGGSRSQGLALKEIPSQFQAVKSRKEITDSTGKVLFKEYQHQNSIYQGISKTRDSVTGQSRYFSWRRVSENSNPDAFIHPGITAHRLLDKAMSNFNIDEEVGVQIDNELIKLGF